MLTRVRWLSDFYFNNLWFQFLKFSETKDPLVLAYLKIFQNQRTSGFSLFKKSLQELVVFMK